MKYVPNILSVMRICLVPVFIVAYLLDESEIRILAISIFVVANASDVIDGIIARKYNAQTKIGKVIDPLGDKLIIFSALVCLSISKPVLTWAAVFYFVKEILMGIGGFIIGRRADIELPHSNRLGKASTVYFFAICTLIMILDNIISDDIANIMMVSAVCLSIAALTRYFRLFVSLMKKPKPQTVTEVPSESGDTGE